jgi:hypothetical protein
MCSLYSAKYCIVLYYVDTSLRRRQQAKLINRQQRSSTINRSNHVTILVPPPTMPSSSRSFWTTRLAEKICPAQEQFQRQSSFRPSQYPLPLAGDRAACVYRPLQSAPMHCPPRTWRPGSNNPRGSLPKHCWRRTPAWFPVARKARNSHLGRFSKIRWTRSRYQVAQICKD